MTHWRTAWYQLGGFGGMNARSGVARREKLRLRETFRTARLGLAPVLAFALGITHSLHSYNYYYYYY